MNFSNLLENNISFDISPLSSFNENFNNYEDFKSESELSKCATCPTQVDPSTQVKKLFQETHSNSNSNSNSTVSELMNKTGLNANSVASNHPPMCNCAPCSNMNQANKSQMPEQISLAVKTVVSTPQFVQGLKSLARVAESKGLSPDVVKSLQINPNESVTNIGNKIDEIGKVAAQIGATSEFVLLRKEFSNALMNAGETLVASENKANLAKSMNMNGERVFGNLNFMTNNQTSNNQMNEHNRANMNGAPVSGNLMMGSQMSNNHMNNTMGESTQSHSQSQTHTHGSSTIFVDLPCYMSKMNNLSAHSDNMMVDLSLLTSNLKSCSYVKKTPELSSGSIFSSSTQNEQGNLMPQQDMIKVSNVPAKVLVTSNSPNKADNNLVVGLTRESFDVVNETLNNITYGWWDTFYVKLIVLLLILYVVMNKK